MTSWDIWTNEPIVVTLTANDSKDIIVDMTQGIVTDSHVSLNTASAGSDTWSNIKVLTISGQYENSLVFHNRI
ncbi:MAG: hypothetical protein GXP45_00430 [bacterium]|nr:hypothetical protein [bacterium]